MIEFLTRLLPLLLLGAFILGCTVPVWVWLIYRSVIRTEKMIAGAIQRGVISLPPSRSKP